MGWRRRAGSRPPGFSRWPRLRWRWPWPAHWRRRSGRLPPAAPRLSGHGRSAPAFDPHSEQALPLRSSTVTAGAYATITCVPGRALRFALPAGSVFVLLALAAQTSAAPSHWRPPARLSWYWQLQGSIDNAHRVGAYDVD